MKHDLITVAEACEILHCSTPTVYRRMEHDGLPYFQFPGKRLIPMSRFTVWLEEHLAVRGRLPLHIVRPEPDGRPPRHLAIGG